MWVLLFRVLSQASLAVTWWTRRPTTDQVTRVVWRRWGRVSPGECNLSFSLASQHHKHYNWPKKQKSHGRPYKELQKRKEEGMGRPFVDSQP